jgi:hypothetical protein
MSKGIDVPIARLNTLFTDNLWTSKTYTKYGRIYRNRKADDIYPESFNANTGDYADVLLNDKLDALSFFDVQPEEDYSGNFVATVWICFAVNLKNLYPSVTDEMATEYAHQDALIQIKRSSFKVDGLVRGFEAFSEYALARSEDSMNPFYLFRFNTNIKYSINC